MATAHQRHEAGTHGTSVADAVCDDVAVITTLVDARLVARLHVDLQRVASAACPSS